MAGTPTQAMIQTFVKLRNLLDRRERRQALALLVVMLVMGLIELAGIASIMPLIAVLSNPKIVETNRYLHLAYEGLDFTNRNSFLIFLSAGSFIVIVGRTLSTAFTSYTILRYANTRAQTLSVRLLGTYLARPYAWFLNRHSADLGRAVLSEVDYVINGSLMPALDLVSGTIIAACIIGLVVAVEPVVAASVTAVVALAYGLVYFSIRGSLMRMGRERVQSNRQRFQITQEVLGGVKEVKIGGLESAYLRRFEKVARQLTRRKSKQQAMSQLPRYFLEIVAIGGVLLLIIALLIRSNGDLNSALPVITLYAFAGLRLLPVIAGVYKDVVTLRFGGPALDALHSDLVVTAPGPEIVDRQPPMKFRKAITLEAVSFTYPMANRPALREISLSIPAQTTVGFVGSTGAGKSTMVDVILGLLVPQQGAVRIDGEPIGQHNVRAWQKSVGYVPQHIFLADESVAANIAFGMASHKIDMAAVERAARMANLHDFVTGELPKSYDTMIGERGIRLSGGQRQRVGIARALYHDPDVLVLDEGTSALDSLTERAVMDAIHSLAHRKTIILIAHRLTTVRACDAIFYMEQGRVTATGRFEDLVDKDAGFRALSAAS